MKDLNQIMSVSDDRSIRVWALEGNSYVQKEELYGHRSRVWSVRETYDMIASVSEDATCKLWVRGVGKPFETLKGHSGKNVRALAAFNDFESQIDMLATGGEDGAIKIWDIYSMKHQKTLFEAGQGNQ